MVILYSTNCPKCHALEKMMNDRGIQFNLELDEEKVIKFGEEQNILSAPILAIDGKYMDFSAAVKWVKENNNER